MRPETRFKCFVPYCSNSNYMTGKLFRFFPVPAGIDGLYWKKAVNKCRTKQYERMIEHLLTNPQLNLKSHLNHAEYCCEMHFDTEADIERIFHEDGSVEYAIKAGCVPSIQALRNRTIDEIDQLHNKDHSSNNTENVGYVSLVDIATLTRQNSKYEADREDRPFEIKSEPMMPLTVALMKKKSIFYTGLQQPLLARLLFLTAQQTTVAEEIVMLTLRKLCLNEHFQVLGDLFDIDKTTAEQHFEESKGLVLDLTATLTNGRISQPTNAIATSNDDTISNAIKLEPMDSVDEYVDENEVKTENKQDIEEEVEEEEDTGDSDSSASDTEYVDESDPDFDIKSLEATDSSEYNSEEEEESDISGESMTKVKAFCPYCDVAVFRLELHIERIHLNPQNINKTICGLCLQHFSNQLILREHQKQLHNGNAYSCDICGFLTKHFRKLKTHISRIHSPLKDFLCDLCGEGFPFAHKLSHHMGRKHLNIRKNACHLCDKKYFDRVTLEMHINAAHTGERPFQCPDCGKSFARQSNLHAHKQTHSESRHVCEICDKKFSFKQNLRTHRKNIHGIMF